MTDALDRLAERLPEVRAYRRQQSELPERQQCNYLLADDALIACATEVERLESAEVELAMTLRETIRATTIHRQRAEQAEAALIYDDAGDHVQTWETRAIVLEQRAEQAEAELAALKQYKQEHQFDVYRLAQRTEGAEAELAAMTEMLRHACSTYVWDDGSKSMVLVNDPDVQIRELRARVEEACDE